MLLYGQNLSIFGSSNWTTASANSQQEHNYFTIKNAIFQWFSAQFDRMWNNSNPAHANETVDFAPLAPDQPVYKLPASGTTVTTLTPTLTWYAGLWAHNYDIYLGTSSTPPLFAANVNLGPSETSTDYVKFTTPKLLPNTKYYWHIVSKTMANVAVGGSTWSFTTPADTAPLPSGLEPTATSARSARPDPRRGAAAPSRCPARAPTSGARPMRSTTRISR